ncbi:hypothetical protein AEQU2_02766 [Aequorivita lipolytica]|nr:hypothetical protein AEQU2_02766 [Aequorivita lipolytica]
MENIINIFHYCIYLIDCKLHFLSNKINPFLLLYKIPYFKRKAKENGESFLDVYNDTYINKEFGLSLFFSAGITGGVIFILMIGLFKLTTYIFRFEILLNSVIYILFGVITYLLCYFLIFIKDKYLVYFKKYENWSHSERRKYIVYSILFTIISICFFFVSLLFLNH